MEINGTDLVVYFEGKPIGVASGATFTLPENDSPVLCTAVPEWNLTFSGKWPELSRLQALEYEWYCSRRMPRKQKKVYRKRLEKAIAYERYREQIDEFLSTLGPEKK